MKIDCLKNQELEAFVGRELDSGRHEQMMRHVESCLKCQKVISHLRAVKDVLRQKIKSLKAPIRLKFAAASMASCSVYEEPDTDDCSSLHSLGFSDAAVPPGTHICFFYESEQERDRVIMEFLGAGVAGGEMCFGAVHGRNPSAVLSGLGTAGCNVNPALERGQLTVCDSSRLFYPEGEFVPDEMINRLVRLSESASEAGYPLLRAFGELSWVREQPDKCSRVVECEHRLNEEFFTRHPAVGVCLYDMRFFKDGFLDDVFVRHPYFIYKGQFKRNPSCICA